MASMSTLEEKTGATAVAQALKTDLSATDWPKEGSVVEVSFMKNCPGRHISILAVSVRAFFMALK